MAERKVIIPGASAPMVDKKGRIDPTWLRFFTDLYERTGGGPVDKVEESAESAETANTAAAAADAAAVTAQAAADAASAAASTAQGQITTTAADLANLRDGVDGNATTLGFYGTTPAAKPTITGSTGGNAALQDTLTKLAALGLITDSTT